MTLSRSPVSWPPVCTYTSRKSSRGLDLQRLLKEQFISLEVLSL